MRVVTRAELLDRLGDTKRAVELLAMIDPSRFGSVQSIDHTAAIYARRFAFRGRLYEKLGERDQAIAAYERFTQLWANAMNRCSRRCGQLARRSRVFVNAPVSPRPLAICGNWG